MQQMLSALVGLFICITLNAQKIPLDTAVHTGTLPNGFKYYIRHNEEPKKRVYLYLVNKIGSVLEDDDQQGLAHFMEHMNFNGTTHFPKNDLVDYLQKSGVRFGADLNAYTSFDETVYQLPLPTDDPLILKNGFQIMRDWAQNATLDSIEIDKERGVVMEEERLGRGAQERMQRQYWPIILNHSRYADRIPIGKVDILNNFPPSAIRRFYADWYRPDLQALVVVGDIDPVKAEGLVKKLFADLKTKANERSRTKYSADLTGQNQFLRVTDKEMGESDLQMLFKHKETKLITEPDYLLLMQRQLFNIMIAERFAALSQTPNLPFISAEAGIEGFLGRLNIFELNITLKEGKFSAGFQMAWKLIEQLKRFGFTETELERARINYLSGEEASLKEKDKTNSESFAGEYQRHFLNQEASPGIDWEYTFVKNHIGQVTLAQINELTKDYITDINRDILVFGSEKDKSILPDSAMVAGWLALVSSKNLTAYKDDISQTSLMPAVPVPGKIVSRKEINSLQITELTLSNGIKIILKPTNFKNDEIRFAAFSPGGTSLYSDKEFQNAANAGIIAGFGVGDINPVQLDKILTGKKFQLEPFINDQAEGLNGVTVPDDLETALQMVYLRFSNPRKDTVLFSNIINNSKEIIENRYSDPKNVFTDTVNLVMGNYNYRRTPPSLAKLMQLDLDEMYRIYKERFSDASGFTFVFVGNFKIDSIRPLLEKYLGGLPALHKNEIARDHGIYIPPGQITKKVFKGSENKATVTMVFSGDYQYSPENNIVLTALKEVLSIKITQHLREDESEVYSPSVQVSYNKYPRSRYAFTVSFGCAPTNAEHLMAGVEKEIALLRKKGPSQEDVNKFKAEYRRIYQLETGKNDYWLEYLTSQYQKKQDPAETLSYLNRLNKITPLMLQENAQLWLNGNNIIRFELLPEQNN